MDTDSIVRSLLAIARTSVGNTSKNLEAAIAPEEYEVLASLATNGNCLIRLDGWVVAIALDSGRVRLQAHHPENLRAVNRETILNALTEHGIDRDAAIAHIGKVESSPNGTAALITLSILVSAHPDLIPALGLPPSL